MDTGVLPCAPMSRDEPFLLLVNPAAGGGRARARLPALLDALGEAGASYELHLTRGAGEATDRVREALASGRVGGVAVVGGDGTLSEAAWGFFDASGRPIAPQAWLGPLPVGTGGDLRRTLGIPSDPGVMVTRMLWAPPRPVDVGWLQYRGPQGRKAERVFLNIASFGVAGLVDRYVAEGPKWAGGTAAFAWGTVRGVLRYRPRRVRLRLDEAEPFEASILNVAVANGRFFGGGMQVAPRARMDDGTFDVVVLAPRGVRETLSLAPALYRGQLFSKPGVRCFRARCIEAEPADWGEPVLLDVDGEVPGSLPARFEVRPGALLLKA